MSESLLVAYLVAFLIIFILALYLSLRMNKNLKIGQPDVKPYAFGYFLGFFGVLYLPLLLFQYAYMPEISPFTLPNFIFEVLFFSTSIGILYRRGLAWIINILATLACSIKYIVYPMMEKSYESFDDFVSQHLSNGDALSLIIMTILLFVLTIYFMKRRYEMPLI
jgi:hypothetical protein